MATLTDGRFIVVWHDGFTNDIHGPVCQRSRRTAGAGFLPSRMCDGVDISAKVAALPDGGFIVTWDQPGVLRFGSEQAQRRQRGDPGAALRLFSGAPAGDLFLVNTGDPLTDQFDPRRLPSICLPARRLITWEDLHEFGGNSEDNEPDGIRGDAFLTTTDIVNGSAGRRPHPDLQPR